MKQFHGRVIFGGTYKGEAVVSHGGFNTLASFQKSALSSSCKDVIVSDQNNADLFKVHITGKALCLPMTIGSTTGGMVIQTIASRNLSPAAWLFSEPIDPLAASGIILAHVWNNVPIIAIDNLGKEFLATVKTGGQIEISEDGTVTVD
jgi:uncharacterized protein